MSIYAYRVAEPRAKCRDFFSCFSCWVKRVGRSGTVDSRSPMTVGRTPLHSVFSPLSQGPPYADTGGDIMVGSRKCDEISLAAQELCSRDLWEGVWGVDLYPLLGYKFLGRVNEKRIQSCCLDDPPRFKQVSFKAHQTNGWLACP